jgi:hypothetical protein
MSQKAAKQFPPTAVERVQADAAAAASAASKTAAQKGDHGLWKRASNDMVTTQAQKQALIEEKKKQREEDARLFEEAKKKKAEEEAAARAAAEEALKAVAAATEDDEGEPQPLSADDEAPEKEDEKEDEKPAAAKKQRPKSAKKPRITPQQPLVAAHKPQENGGGGYQKLDETQMNHLNHIYSMMDTVKHTVTTLQSYTTVLLGVMPQLGMIDKLPQAAQDQMLLQYNQAPLQNGFQPRYRPIPQQISWEDDGASDDSADEPAEGTKKRTKKRAASTKPPKEDKFAAKNILTEDDKPAALDEAEAADFITNVSAEIGKKIEGFTDKDSHDRRIDQLTGGIRGFFTNNGTSLTNYHGKERLLLISLAACIRMLYPDVIGDVGVLSGKGNSRAHILTRLARDHKTTLLDPTPLGALIKKDGVTTDFMLAFVNVLAYYECFLVRANIDPKRQ